MKREILCRNCFPKTLGGEAFPGEHVKYVQGKLLHDAYCDRCGDTLIRGNEAVACSLWADHGGGYYEWESEYVTTNDEAAQT